MQKLLGSAQLQGANNGNNKQSKSSCPTLQASLFGTFHQNSGRTGYTTEGALFIFIQLSTDTVRALRKGLGTFKTVKATQSWSMHVNVRPVRSGLKKMSSVSFQQTILILFEMT